MKRTKVRKKVVFYARVSTHDQQTLQMQIDGIKGSIIGEEDALTEIEITGQERGVSPEITKELVP